MLVKHMNNRKTGSMCTHMEEWFGVRTTIKLIMLYS